MINDSDNDRDTCPFFYAFASKMHTVCVWRVFKKLHWPLPGCAASTSRPEHHNRCRSFRLRETITLLANSSPVCANPLECSGRAPQEFCHALGRLGSVFNGFPPTPESLFPLRKNCSNGIFSPPATPGAVFNGFPPPPESLFPVQEYCSNGIVMPPAAPGSVFHGFPPSRIPIPTTRILL